MIEWLQVITLALVQGITEFLPVSSSAHLILVSEAMGRADQNLAFDIAVHWGTLWALILYFRRDLQQMVRAWVRSLYTHTFDGPARLLWSVGFATIPVGLAGLFGKAWIETHLRAPQVIAITTIVFGLMLWAADAFGKQQRTLVALKGRDVLMIGVSQIFSLIPGASRSGVTLSAGLLNGLTREAAARFSFLLSIPVILLAGGLELYSLLNSPFPISWGFLSVGAVVAAFSGYGCIHYFFKLLNTIGLFPFILYRLCLGAYLIYQLY